MDEKIKVMLLMEEGYIRDSVRVILSVTEDIVLVGETDNLGTALELIKKFTPDITIVGEEVRGNDGFALSQRIMDEDPFHPIIFIATRLNVDTYKNALYVGIKEVLKAPLYPDELKSSIVRVHKASKKAGRLTVHMDAEASLENEVKPDIKETDEEESRARIISTFSIKGGVGKTTISTNLAVTLAQGGNKTALLDLDIYSGDVALAMNIIPRRRVSDLGNDIQRLDLDLLESYMVRHPSGVMVFLAPFNIEHADYIKLDHIEKVLDLLKQEYDYIIIDCPSYFYDIAMMTLKKSDVILLVATMDILSLKSIKNTISVLENAKVAKNKMKLVLNKYIRGVGLTVNDVEATLSMPVTTVIPLENQLAISSMNQGIPFVAGMRRAKVSRGIYNLAREILVMAGGKA